MIQYYDSGFINFRNRKIGIVFNGQSDEHIMDNYISQRSTHPFKHQRIQQLAKLVTQWTKESAKRYTGGITDDKTGEKVKIVVEIYTKFAIIITCYKY
jgi:hypothetical protein